MRNGSARQAASRVSKGRQSDDLNATVQERTAAGAAGATPDAADGEGRHAATQEDRTAPAGGVERPGWSSSIFETDKLQT